jgi:membrane fusion protein, multidrug efflux system
MPIEHFNFISALFKFFKRNIVLSITLIIVIIIIGYSFWINRKPFTQNAFVEANVRVVSAYVPGYITDIYVKNNEIVRKNTKLLTVFQEPYKLTLQQLNKDLERAKYNAEALLLAINIAKFKVKQIELKYKNSKYLSDQAESLDNVLAQKTVTTDLATTNEASQSLKIAKEELTIKELEHKQAIAHIQSLEAQGAKAALNLKLTTVYSETSGIVNNMHLSVGTYVQPGSPLFAFIDNSAWWVQANFSETQLSQVKKGMKAKIWLWQYPGVAFKGVVADTNWGVNRNIGSQATGMSEVQKENQWFMLPQRFPVQILITDIPKGYKLHSGGSAYVQIETSAHPIRQIFWRLFQL